MFLLGTKPNHRPPSGPGEIRDCLDEVRRTGAIFKIENAQGREVPACIKHLSAREVTVQPADPLDLGLGEATNLIYILNDFRFKAPTRALGTGPGGITVALPEVVLLAERRKKARGYLNVALLGLFSPMAAAAAMPEPATTYSYEPGAQAVALEHRPAAETGASRAVPVEGLVRPGPAAGPGLLDTYLHDWLQNRTPTMVNNSLSSLAPGLPVPGSPIHAHHGGLLAHGVSFHFVPCSLPGHWLGSGRSANVNFEAHIDRHNVQLGIRIK